MYWIGCFWIAATVGGIGCEKQGQPGPADNIRDVIELSQAEQPRQAVLGEVGPSEVVPATEEPSDLATEYRQASTEPQQLTDSSEPLVRITVSGAKSIEGVYTLALFDNEDSFVARTDPKYSKTISADVDEAVWELESVAAGTYALAVFHDQNENGVLDRTKFGFPIEAYGFSNNARGKFGPPSFDKVKFEVGSEPVEQNISIK